MQINLTGFMEKNTSLFMKELWRLVISASKNPQGIPDEILEEQKAMHEKQVEAQKRVQEEIAKRMGRRIGAQETGETPTATVAAVAAAAAAVATAAAPPAAKRKNRCVLDGSHEYLYGMSREVGRVVHPVAYRARFFPAERSHRWGRDTEADAKDGSKSDDRARETASASKRPKQEDEDGRSRSGGGGGGQSRERRRDRRDQSRESERR